MLGVTWNVVPESSSHVCAYCELYRTSLISDSSRERISPGRDSATFTWLPVGQQFESHCPCVWSDRWLFCFLFMDQQLKTLHMTNLSTMTAEDTWSIIPQFRLLSVFLMSRSTRVSAGSLGLLSRTVEPIDRLGRVVSFCRSSMVSPIDFHQMSFVRTWHIVSSRFSFGQLLAKVLQNTSQLAGRLESNVRAFTSSSKLIPWEESSDNTRLKVLLDRSLSSLCWIVVGLVSILKMRTSSHKQHVTSPTERVLSSPLPYWNKRFRPNAS